MKLTKHDIEVLEILHRDLSPPKGIKEYNQYIMVKSEIAVIRKIIKYLIEERTDNV